MNEKQIIRIKEFLSKEGLYFETIGNKKVEQLCLIDDEIQKRLSILEQLKKQIEINSINIASISKSVKIARKTIYNNQILKKYIEAYSIDFQKEINKCRYDNLVVKVGEYARELKLLQLKDIDNENLRCENDRLLKEIKSLNERIKFLEEQSFNTLKN